MHLQTAYVKAVELTKGNCTELRPKNYNVQRADNILRQGVENYPIDETLGPEFMMR